MSVPEEVRAAARRALALSDEALARECEETFFVGGGPGGQHRNKTETAVRLVHGPTGVTVTATERRSQPQNRAAALARLRARLEALAVRPKPRRATRPTRGSNERRLAAKKRRGERKVWRGGVDEGYATCDRSGSGSTIPAATRRPMAARTSSGAMPVGSRASQSSATPSRLPESSVRTTPSTAARPRGAAHAVRAASRLARPLERAVWTAER
jgi:ribosome-associated protein